MAEEFVVLYAAMTQQTVVFISASEAQAKATLAGSRQAWDDELWAAGAFGPGGPYRPDSSGADPQR